MLLFPDGDGIGAGVDTAQGAQGDPDAGAGQSQPAQPDPSARYYGERDQAWNGWLASKGDPGALKALHKFAAAHGMTLAEAKQEIKEQQDPNKPKEDPEQAEMRAWYKEQKAQRESQEFDRNLASEVEQAVGTHPLVKDPDLGPIARDYVAGMRLLRPDLSPSQVYKMAAQSLETALGKYVARVGGRKTAVSAVTPLRGGGSAGGAKAPKFDPSKVSFAQMAEKTAVQLDAD